MAQLERIVERFVKEGSGKGVSAANSMNHGVSDEDTQEEFASATFL